MCLGRNYASAGTALVQFCEPARVGPNWLEAESLVFLAEIV